MIFPRLRRLAMSGALLSFSTLVAAPAAHAVAEPLDAIVVVVNDGVILQSELDRAMRGAEAQIRERGIAAPPKEVLRAQVLERLILLRLQTQRATEAGIKVDDRDLNEVINNIATQNKMTLPQFNEALKQEGMDYLGFREQIRDELMVQRVRQKEVGQRVLVTDQDVNLYLSNPANADQTEYKLSHILVALPDAANPDARAKAREKADSLLKRVRGGEDFAAVAIANSDGQTALQGGDLGWRKAGDLPTLFVNVLPKMSEGQISDVIEGANGFNLIEVTGKRSAGEKLTVTETHARHILLVPNTIRDEDASRALSDDLYARLKKGEDFATLAKKYSDDPGSKNSGGDLGWQPPGVFAPEFQIKIDQLKPDEIGTPFKSQFGWHVAEVLGRRTRDNTEEARRGRARQAIAQRKEVEDYEAWLRRLREEAYIEYRNGTTVAAGGSDAGSASKTP